MTAIDLCTILVKTCVLFGIMTAYIAYKTDILGHWRGTCV